MEDKEKNIDLGNWTVPTKWEDITLKQYQDIERFYADTEKDVDVREIVHIMCNKTIDEVNQLPTDFLEEIMTHLLFLQTTPTVDKPTNKIKINGEEYSINVMEKLKTGEYVATDSVLNNDKHDYASILAILCRKENEIYDSKFEAETFNNRVKMWEEAPVIKILPLVNFFLDLWLISEQHSHMYSHLEEAINLIAKDIENSDKIGLCRRLYLRWRITKLRKSLKLTSNTSLTSLSSSPILSRKVKWRKKKSVFKTK